ncbi:MAG: ABC transporter permease subunit [Proteobacteria bacterium]|nr:ABC transporter permease subunit [Pseudomonadota bacterium]
MGKFSENLRELVSEGIDAQGLLVVFKKELADHFSSYRFIILFALIAMVSLISTYMTGVSLRDELEGIAKPKLVFLMLFTSGAWLSLDWFVAFLFPLIGIVLGFDSINRELSSGTMSKLVSQPIFRDSVINGKFLAGITTIAIMLVSIVLVISGLGLLLLGVVPGIEEVWRIIIYLVISIIYVSFWLGIAMLSSIVFRSIATSALASIAVWVFFFIFTLIGPPTLAKAFAPINQVGLDSETIVLNARIQEGVRLSSPMGLYSDATATVMNPMQKTTKSLVLMGPMERLSASRFQSPLSLTQSILVVWPYIVSLFALTLVCFGFSYGIFMRQEIRSA